MAMDFFEHQQRARQRSGLLLFYFGLAILLTVLAVNAVLYFATQAWAQPGLTLGGWIGQPHGWWAALATLAVIATGSLSTWFSLRAGGRVIAETVGARRIDPDTSDLQERTLLNVVEEMAIASGTPAPTTYVMDHESGINAFVAGFQPTEAVLVVTRGALDAFDRDEMQGVVGHEFSHILNGDMRMNVNLYALLAGILAIGRVGEFMMRNAGRSRSRNDKGAGAAVALLGFALMVIGYIGLFFGRLIKAAISRQREWLADASSVQFTRNPRGIGEALLKIRNASHGGLIDNSHAEDMSHMCFALPVKLRFAGLFATHPPLDERIQAIDPSLLPRDRARARNNGGRDATAADVGGVSAFAPRAGSPAIPANPATPVDITASVGLPTPGHLALAGRLHASIPDAVRDALRTPAGARALVYAIVVASMDRRHEADTQRLVAANDSQGAGTRLLALLPDVRRMGTRLFLPCLDLSLPALREMSQDQKEKFLSLLTTLTQLDQRLSLREYLVLTLMRKHLAPTAGAARPARHRAYRDVAGPLNTVMSLLCHASGGDEAAREALHAREMRMFALGGDMPPLLPLAGLGAAPLRAALAELADLSPLLKKPLLDACVDCVSRDGKLQVAEIELVRILGDALDCPIPPWAGEAG